MGHSKRVSAAIFGAVMLIMGAGLYIRAQAADYTAQEQANIKVVADFYAALDRGDADHDTKQKIRSIAEKYLAPDYTQHNPAMRAFGPGREGLIKMFQSMPAAPAVPAGAGAPPPAKVLFLGADGNMVVRISSRSMPGGGSDSVIFNMFRVQDGKLAEHWDATSGGAMGRPGGRARGPGGGPGGAGGGPGGPGGPPPGGE